MRTLLVVSFLAACTERAASVQELLARDSSVLIVNPGPLNTPIPDNDATGQTQRVVVDVDFPIRLLRVDLVVSHPRVGDLVATLIAPDGREAVLFDRQGGNWAGINTSYESHTGSATELTMFDGMSSAGEWQLHIADTAPNNVGTLQGLTIAINDFPDLAIETAEVTASPNNPNPGDRVTLTANVRLRSDAWPRDFTAVANDAAPLRVHSLGTSVQLTQEFTLVRPIHLSSIELPLSLESSSGALLVELHVDEGNSPGAAMATAITSPVTLAGWTHFYLADGVALAPGKYWIVLQPVSNSSLGWYANNEGSTYGNARVRTMSGGTWNERPGEAHLFRVWDSRAQVAFYVGDPDTDGDGRLDSPTAATLIGHVGLGNVHPRDDMRSASILWDTTGYAGPAQIYAFVDHGGLYPEISEINNINRPARMVQVGPSNCVINTDPCDGDDSDLCAEGNWVCNNDTLECNDDDAEDDLDLCNGVDDDCNPSTPDGFHEPGFGQACDGPDLGSCADDMWICSSGAIGLVCSTSADELDLCNGSTLDDCDDTTPDGFHEPGFGQACDGPDLGACADDVYDGCVGQTLVCDAQGTGDPEMDLCNGDTTDDCDPGTEDGRHESWFGLPCDGSDADACNEGGLACVNVAGSPSQFCVEPPGDTCDLPGLRANLRAAVGSVGDEGVLLELQAISSNGSPISAAVAFSVVARGRDGGSPQAFVDSESPSGPRADGVTSPNSGRALVRIVDARAEEVTVQVLQRLGVGVEETRAYHLVTFLPGPAVAVRLDLLDAAPAACLDARVGIGLIDTFGNSTTASSWPVTLSVDRGAITATTLVLGAALPATSVGAVFEAEHQGRGEVWTRLERVGELELSAQSIDMPVPARQRVAFGDGDPAGWEVQLETDASSAAPGATVTATITIRGACDQPVTSASEVRLVSSVGRVGAVAARGSGVYAVPVTFGEACPATAVLRAEVDRYGESDEVTVLVRCPTGGTPERRGCAASSPSVAALLLLFAARRFGRRRGC